MSIVFLSCNDNAVIENQHTQKKFVLQTHFVDFLAGSDSFECSDFLAFCAVNFPTDAEQKTHKTNKLLINIAFAISQRDLISVCAWIFENK